MGRHEVPEENVGCEAELGEDPVDDRRSRLARRLAAHLPLGRERDAAYARAAIPGRLSDEKETGFGAALEVVGEPATAERGAWTVPVEVEGRADLGRRQSLDEGKRVDPHRPLAYRAVRRLTFPLYVGGFLGPFGGGMLAALIPSVAAGLDTSLALVAAAITAYMVPFAALQLVSGTLAERLGPRRVVRTGYVLYGGAAVACAFAPEIWSFIGARAAMGAANAFLSPILLAALSEVVAPEVLGRSVGTFAAWQTAGLTLAPALGGALGEVSWRLAFVLVGTVAFVLAVPRQSLGGFERDGAGASLRSLLNRWISLLAVQAMLGYLGFTAIGFVLVLVAAEEFGLGPGTRGLLIAGYGIGGILLGRYAGSIVDRFGRPGAALAGAIACTGGVLGLFFAGSAWALALVYFGIGCASAFVWAGLNTIAVESFPQNRAGATSAYSAFKFAGVAIAPLIYVPLFHVDTRAPFLLAAGFSALLAVLVLPWFARYR
jgi:MFS family permease